MGLDTVELVMEMEETFEIIIDDIDAEQIGTVGQAYRYILSRVELRTAAPCPSAALFYRLRRSLMDRSGADRRSIRPASRIGDYLPEPGRRAAWLGLGEELGIVMPSLVLAPRQRLMALDIGLACGIASLAAGIVAIGGIMPLAVVPNVGTGCLIFALGLASGWVVTLCFLRPSASMIPPGCETIRGTILAALGRQPDPSEGVPRTWHPDEVWAVLRELIAKQLGVDRDLITEEKHFVYDLGAD